MLLIFVVYVNYIVETYTVYAASAIAANSMARYAIAAAVPLFTKQMFSALGIGGGGSLLGGVATLLAAVPFFFAKYGKSIRDRSKFTNTAGPAEEEEWNKNQDPTEFKYGTEESKGGDGEESASSGSTVVGSSEEGEKAEV